MTHTYHDNLPGFDRRNILHDGCPECESRAKDPATGILKMDVGSVLTWWRMMMQLDWSGGDESTIDWPVSQCDRTMIRYLYRVAVLQERMCGTKPEGTLVLMMVARS